MATHKSDEPSAAPAPVAAPAVGGAAAAGVAAATPPSAAVLAAVADAKNPVRQTPAAAGAAKKQRRPKDQTPISRRKEYTHFRASVPLIRASVGQEGKQWLYYEIVSKTDPSPPPPLIMLGGTSSTADMCFPQLLALGYRGYRVVSAQWPAYWSIEEWVAGLHKFVTSVLKTKKCHLFGSSLGGYLALQYTAAHPDAVESLALCNAFCDTTPFLQSQNCLKMFRYLPEFYLKRYVLESFPVESDFPEVIDFVVEQLETLNSDDLGSRLMLNCMPSRLPHLDKFDQRKITIIDATDDVVLPQAMRDALYKRFATAKFALMKSGGDFPFLANPEEVTMLLQVHLRAHGVFPDLNTANKPSEAKAAPAAAGAGAGGVPFLKLTTPLVVGSPAKAAGAGELVGGSAAAAAGGQGQGAAVTEKPPPPPETEAMKAKRLQEEESAARLAELKAKHDREAAEREAKAKAAADAAKAAADAKAAALRAAADEAERKRADEEARRKQKTSGLLTGLLGDKPAPSAFEDDTDPFPATEQQRKEMGSGAPIAVVPVAASVADIVKAMPTAVTAEERAAVEAAKAKAKAAAEAEAAAANGDADAAPAAAEAATVDADAAAAGAAASGKGATAAADADNAAPALEESDAPAAAAASAKAAAAPAAAGKRAKKGRARKGKTIFDQTDG